MMFKAVKKSQSKIVLSILVSFIFSIIFLVLFVSANGGIWDPAPVGFYTANSGDYSLDGVRSITSEGNYTYTVSHTYGTLVVWNNTLHGNPVPVGTYTSIAGNDTLEGVNSLVVSNGYLYTLSYTDDTLVVWNVSGNGNPVWLGNYTDSDGDYSLDSGTGITVDGDYVYTVSYLDSVLSVFNISAHGNPVPVGTFTDIDGANSIESPYDVAVYGGYAYVGSFADDTLTAFDISAHGNPVPVGYKFDNYGDYSLDSVSQVEAFGNYVYTVSWSDDELVVFDISAHGNPVPVGTYTADWVHEFAVSDSWGMELAGDYLYVTTSQSKILSVWNISSNSNPVPIGKYYSNAGDYNLEGARGVVYQDGYVHVTTTSDNYVVFNVSLQPDTRPPTYSLNQTNTTIAGETIIFSILFDDDTFLESNGQYTFSTNNTGVWVNDSAINFTSTPSWANVTKTLNDTDGLTIGYRWYATDNLGNVNNTEIFTLLITPANVAPTVNITVPEVASNQTGIISINWTTTEPDGDSYLTNVTANNGSYTTNISLNLADSISNTTWDTSTVVDGVWNLTVESCENSTSDLFCGNDTNEILVDNTFPVILIITPTDGYIINDYVSGIVPVEVNFSLTETNPSSCWYTINSGVANTSVACLSGYNNFTLLLTSTGVFPLIVYSNDSVGNVNSSSISIIMNPYIGPSQGGSSSINPSENEVVDFNLYNRTIMCEQINEFLELNFQNYTWDKKMGLKHSLEIIFGFGIINSVLDKYLNNFEEHCPEYFVIPDADDLPDPKEETLTYIWIFIAIIIAIILALILLLKSNHINLLFDGGSKNV